MSIENNTLGLSEDNIKEIAKKFRASRTGLSEMTQSYSLPIIHSEAVERIQGFVNHMRAHIKWAKATIQLRLGFDISSPPSNYEDLIVTTEQIDVYAEYAPLYMCMIAGMNAPLLTGEKAYEEGNLVLRYTK